VTFGHSPRSAVPGVYADADVVVFPVEWEEPWGLVPIEAMSVGRPVVATGLGGGREYMTDGRNCLLSPPRDDVALARAVLRLSEDADLRDRLQAGGRATAQHFTDAAFERTVLAEHERMADRERPTVADLSATSRRMC